MNILVLLDLIWSNIDLILAAILSTHALALFIVNLTPTPKDDAFVAKFYKGVEVFAGIVSTKAKHKPEKLAKTASKIKKAVTS